MADYSRPTSYHHRTLVAARTGAIAGEDQEDPVCGSDQNGIPYNSTTMENWWKIIGDWDATITDQIKLFQ